MIELPLDVLEKLGEAVPHIELTDADAGLFFDLLVCPGLEDRMDAA